MDPTYATSSAPPQSATNAPTPAPAPKAAEQQAVPTKDVLLNARPPDLSKADADTLRSAISGYTGAYFKGLGRAVDNVEAALLEPKHPPEEGLAIKLLAGLVGTLSELALNYVSVGLVGLVEPKVGAHIAEALKKAAKTVATKGGSYTGGKVENYLKAQQQGPANPDGDGEIAWMNPSAGSLVKEYIFRQKSDLEFRQEDVHVEQLVGAIGHATSDQIRSLANDLQKRENLADFIGRFQEQVVFGWMNFLTQVSLGSKTLVQPHAASNSVEASKLDANDHAGEASGAIDVYIKLPKTVYGVAGMELDRMTTDAGPGAARALSHRGARLMLAPVVRRIWLVSGEGALGRACPLILYPNGGISIDDRDGGLEAIGKMVPVSREAMWVSHPESHLVEMGAQLLLNWLQPQNSRDWKTSETHPCNGLDRNDDRCEHCS